MAQITEVQRIRRIRELLDELSRQPPQRHETLRLPSSKRDQPLLCPVIVLDVDEVLLNHRSHRLRSQLEDDPEWADLRADPHSEAAQRVIARHVREARTPEQFAALKESLQSEGQSDPGVITHDGVLINANTRAVALRELDDPRKRYIRVAVLPDTIQPPELALLELRLQMQKELKAEYSLTNELLFIEELSSERSMTSRAIAEELRIFPESPKKGESEVTLRLQMLDLLRALQRIPEKPLPFSFFDRISYEQLREVLRNRATLLQTKADPAAAEQYLESFLLSIAVGVTAVHQLRHVDVSFMADYMVPQLEDDEVIGPYAPALTSSGDRDTPTPAGADLLVAGVAAHDASVDVRGLIDMVTSNEHMIRVPGSAFKIERSMLEKAINNAIIFGARDKRADDGAADRLQAPLEAVRAATKQVGRAIETSRALRNNPEFDGARKRSLEAGYKKLRRTVRNLETELASGGIIADS